MSKYHAYSLGFRRDTAEKWLMMMTVMVILIVKVYHIPGYITAVTSSDHKQINSVLDQANQAISERQWLKAKSLLKNLEVNSQAGLSEEIDQKFQWCRANLAIEKRYADPTLATSILAVSDQQALLQLKEVLKLVDQKYYTTIDYKLLLNNALLQLTAVLDYPEIQDRYPIDISGLKKLRRHITQAKESFTDRKNIQRDDIVEIAISLSQFDTSYGLQSWPILEMAYAIAQSLDTYSYLLSPSQYQVLQDRLKGYYVGIGVDLLPGEKYPVVFDVISQSPAKKSGIEPGDMLIQVGEQDLAGLSIEKIGTFLSVKKGVTLPLIVRRNHKEFLVKIYCEIIDAPSVRSVKNLGDQQQTGYFRISSFDRDTAMEMRREIDTLMQQGVTSLMIDLRYNGGGMMSSAIDAVRLFIDQGVITTVHKGQDISIYRAGGEGFSAYQLPLILLVDQNTASAAEIFVAALKDHQRATVIGQKTFGKGLVQTVYHLKNSDSALCLTTASFVPPSSNSFHAKGITPDISIENAPSKLKNSLFTVKKPDEDPILHVALQRFLLKNTL